MRSRLRTGRSRAYFVVEVTAATATCWTSRHRCAAFAATIARGIQCFHAVADNVHRRAARAVLCGVFAQFNTTFHGHKAALLDVLLHEFGFLTPCLAAEKVGLSLTLFVFLKAVNRNRKRGHG